MLKTNISNHPHFENITRTAEVTSLTFNEKSIRLEVTIEHYINDSKLGDMDKSIDLLLNNEKTYQVGNEFIGDLDAFIMQAEAGLPFKQMVQAGLMSVDADGTINAKCMYKSAPAPIPVEE